MTCKNDSNLALFLGCALAASGCAADASEEPRGSAGAPVWFDSSISATIVHHWFYDTFGPNAPPPQSGSECSVLTRDAMSTSQLRALTELVLIPITGACTADGYSYHELSVLDEDQTLETYRTTGCDFLKVPDATVMLPETSFGADSFPLDGAQPCDP